MKNNRTTYPGFTPKVEAVIIASITIALIGFFTYLLYKKSIITLEQEIKIGLKSNVTAAATTINGDIHPLFTAETEREDSLYISQNLPLENILKVTKDIRYIYTNVLVDDKVHFILNPSEQNDNDNDGFPDQAPALMDEYNTPPPALLKALKEQKSTVSDVYFDQWGTFVSGYAPFYNSNGTFIGTLGMDLELDFFYQRLQPIKIAFEKTIIIIIFIGLVIGLLFWYIRKRTQTLLVAKNEHAIIQQSIQTSLEDAYKESIEITKKIKANLTYLKPFHMKRYRCFEEWITHVIQYQKSKIIAGNFTPVSFDIEALVTGIKSNVEKKGITLNIVKDEEMPVSASGAPLLLSIDLISTLVFFLHSTYQNKVLDLSLKLLHEGVDNLVLELKIAAKKHSTFEEEFSKQLNPEVNFLDKSSEDKEFKIATALNLLNKCQTEVVSFSHPKHCGFYVNMTLSKHPED